MRCQGTTVNGRRCKNTTAIKPFCWCHKNQEVVNSCTPLQVIKEVKEEIITPVIKTEPVKEVEINQDLVCCVCIDESDLPIPLIPCNHLIHTKCVWMAGKDLCPLCRQKVLLSRDESVLMRGVARRMKREQDDEEEYELIEEYAEEPHPDIITRIEADKIFIDSVVVILIGTLIQMTKIQINKKFTPLGDSVFKEIEKDKGNRTREFYNNVSRLLESQLTPMYDIVNDPYLHPNIREKQIEEDLKYMKDFILTEPT